MRSLADIPRQQAAENPDKPALICHDRTLTYRDLDAESSQVANALIAAGVSSQSRVGFIGKNIAEYFTLVFGAAKINAVTVAVNWRLVAAEMAYILNHAEVEVVMVEEEFLGHLGDMDLPHRPRVVLVGAGTAAEGQVHYSDWIEGQPATDPAYPSVEDDTGLQLYTSGTTGLPKGAELSNRNLFSIIGPISGMLGMHTDSVVLHVLPLFHIGGSGVATVGLYVGCTNVVHRDVDPARIFADIAGHRVNAAFMVPALLQFLPMMPGASDVDFSSLESIVYGASPITEEALTASMALLKCPHTQVYGLTETTGALTLLASEDHDPGGPRAKLLRSAGKPLPGVELRLVDADGRDVDAGEVGEVWARTVQNLKGYWRDPEATAEAFPEGRDEHGLGWFRTGDAGFMEDGYLFIHDRIKDMIVSGGENVYPAEIENALMAHPSVADVAVIGIPSERWGESPLALIVPAPDTDPSEEELIAHCRQLLAGFKIPAAVERIDAVPRNPSGKILKTELRKPYWEARDRQI